MKKPSRAAIYARVSTDDTRQDPETQLLELRDYADRRGFEVVGEYIDYASGKTDQRTRYQELLTAARRRQIDVVLVWRYDRFARSTVALINALSEFRTLGVDFISFQENIDTTTPQGELIFSIMASLAQFESSLLSDRVKAGMRRAKSQGKRISRPKISPEIRSQIEQLHRRGVSIKKISTQLPVSYGTAWNYVNRIRKEAVAGR